MDTPHILVHTAEVTVLSLTGVGYYAVKRHRHVPFFRVVSALAWLNVAVWLARLAMAGFPSPWAGANENIESWMWFADYALTSIGTAYFCWQQGSLGRLSKPGLWIALTLIFGAAVSLPVILSAVASTPERDAGERSMLASALYATSILIGVAIVATHFALFGETGGAFVLRSATNATNTYVMASVCIMFTAVLAWAMPTIKNPFLRFLLIIPVFMFVAVGLPVYLLTRQLKAAKSPALVAER